MAVHEITERRDGVVEEYHEFAPGEMEQLLSSLDGGARDQRRMIITNIESATSKARAAYAHELAERYEQTVARLAEVYAVALSDPRFSLAVRH